MKHLIDHLSGFVTEKRKDLIFKTIEDRTDYLTVVLEDIYQPHNASAVLRTCDCFGIQTVHVIENRNAYKINPDVALGASQWLDLIKHNTSEHNTLETIEKLRADGYRIVATTPHKNDLSLEDFDLKKGKAALFFGTEKNGLSDLVLENADEYVKIPMYGFTESFNISVSASIILYQLTLGLRRSEISWKFSEQRKQEVLLKWFRQSIKMSDKIIEKFLSQ